MTVRLPRAVDALIAASVLFIALVSAASGGSSPVGEQRHWDTLGYALMVAQVLPLLWRQQAPRAVAWATTAVWIVIQGLGYPASLAVIAPFIAIYGLAAYTSRRTAYTHTGIIGGILVAWTSVGVFSVGFVDVNALISVAFGVILPFALGFVEHDRAAGLAELERVHARQEQAEAEAAQQAVITERTRIARELHDVVAHEMTVMTLQAEGARRLAAGSDERLTEALTTIAAAGRSGLAEMQRMIGVLRESAEGETSGGLTPAPSLADVPALARQVREAGMPVRLSITGDANLPAGVELNAFRLIQEALTNSLKYAGPGASAVVEIRKAPDAVTVSVRDDGRGASAAGTGGGHGLVGMRERVEALGGTLDVGPAKGGGYRLNAVLPVTRRSPEPTRMVGTLDGTDA